MLNVSSRSISFLQEKLVMQFTAVYSKVLHYSHNIGEKNQGASLIKANIFQW